MNPEKAEPLARWADALQATLEEIRAQQSRPLPSPGLRCLGALVHSVRLARVVRDAARLVEFGSTQARWLASAGAPWEALCLCGPIVLRTGCTVGRATGALLHAVVQAGREGWAACAKARSLSRPSVAQLLSHTVTLGRAARMALKEVSYDRR